MRERLDTLNLNKAGFLWPEKVRAIENMLKVNEHTSIRSVREGTIQGRLLLTLQDGDHPTCTLAAEAMADACSNLRASYQAHQGEDQEQYL